METIFDHNITKEEQIVLYGHVLDKEQYLSFHTGPDTDSSNGELFHLFSIRNDRRNAFKYLNKVKDKQFKFDLQSNDILSETESDPAALSSFNHKK